MQASKDQIKTISRLGPQAAFDVLRKNRQKRWVSEGFIVQVLPKHESRASRKEAYGVCVSVSKKTAKRAHDRNRIKRRLRAVAFEIIPANAAEDMDYMIIGRLSSLTREYDQMKKDMIWCLKKLELLKRQPVEKREPEKA